MFKNLFVLALVFSVSYGLHFKLDYTYYKSIDGWLKLHLVPATWNDARLRCHAKGGILASPLTHKLRKTILNHVMQKNLNIPVIFTGVHAIFSKGDYASIDGVPLTRLPVTWVPGEPDNKQDLESCLAMQVHDGAVMDVQCSDTLPYVCYKKKTDKDLKYVSNCRTIDPEYKLELRTGSCYKFHRWGQSWSRAYMTCAAEGAHLAIVNSATESEVLIELYAQNTNDVIVAKKLDATFLGYRYWDIDWMTIHSETMAQAGFEHWYVGEPNNATQPEGEFCVTMDRGGDFKDGTCSPTLAFICEKEVILN